MNQIEARRQAEALAERARRTGPGGEIAYAQRTTDHGSAITTLTDLTDLTVTFDVVAGRAYLIHGKVEVLSTVAGDVALANISDSSNNQVNRCMIQLPKVSSPATGHIYARLAPVASGSVTYKLRMGRDSGTGNLTSIGQATNPAFIQVTDLGVAA